jgi:Gas vesicle synthesis protein GvpL/GvpF
VIYLYAIVDGVDDVADMHGIQGEPLSTMELAALRLVIGDVVKSPGVDAQALAAQDRVVRELTSRASALLPMRFGATFTTIDAARDALDTQRDGLRERLERVRGREQMSLRALGAGGRLEASGAVGATGTEYLRQRSRPRELAPVLDAVASLVHGTHVERGRVAGVITVYHLIDRGSGDDYRVRAEAASQDLAGITIHVSGPSPCYAFASAT